MDTLWFVALGFWLLTSIVTVWFLESFRRYVERSTTSERAQGFAAGEWPVALVIMSLRGGDETLRATLTGLAAQDYPRYRIRIVIDHPSDEVNRVVRAWQRSYSGVPVNVEYLREPSPSCTLKCSSIYQVLRSVDSDVDVVVVVDGDADPYPHWLRDAVTPFVDERIGGVTGNRWYFPREGGGGAWCRFVFTAFSLPTVWRQGFSWGGTLALRRDIACSEEFLAAFIKTPTEEQTCYEVLPRFGKSMYFSPQLIQWNPAPIGVHGAEEHVFRQLAWAKSFYPCWTAMLLGTAAVWSATVASLILAGFALSESRPGWTLPLLSGFMFAAVIVNSLDRLHQTLQSRVFARQGRKVPTLNWERCVDLFVGVVSSLGIYAIALVRAHLTREIRWRGILYRILSNGKIRMAGYSPFRPAVATPPGRFIPVPAQSGVHE